MNFSRATFVAGQHSSLYEELHQILSSIVAALICVTAFSADQPVCKKTGKNCPMNNGKACNCGKSCDC
jgi:hypothetical protein